MCGEEETPLIFGKPFLAGSLALIPDKEKELVLRTDDKEESHHEQEDKEEDQEKLLVE
ncbi:hypothetical protein A2U01_0097400, partial [Trifolium medium]|nr:hypothetical protein [Trifolium medium]